MTIFLLYLIYIPKFYYSKHFFMKLQKNLSFIYARKTNIISQTKKRSFIMSDQKVNKDMTIQEIVDKYPKSVPIFMAHGLHCVGCHAANWESVEQGAAGHGIDLDPLLKDLNELAGK